jgi:hypothetical protein
MLNELRTPPGILPGVLTVRPRLGSVCVIGNFSVAIQLRVSLRGPAPKAGAYFVTWFRLPGWPGGYFLCHQCRVVCLCVLGPTPLFSCAASQPNLYIDSQMASFAGAPITDDKRCHVTQPRWRINVGCGRAGQKGRENHKKGGCQAWVPARPGYQTWDETGRDRDSIALKSQMKSLR